MKKIFAKPCLTLSSLKGQQSVFFLNNRIHQDFSIKDEHILDYNLADDFEFRCTVHIICTLKITCRSHRKVSTAFKTSHGIQTMYFANQCITQPMYYAGTLYTCTVQNVYTVYIIYSPLPRGKLANVELQKSTQASNAANTNFLAKSVQARNVANANFLSKKCAGPVMSQLLGKNGPSLGQIRIYFSIS